MAGRALLAPRSYGYTLSFANLSPRFFLIYCAIRLVLLGIFRISPWLVRMLGQTGLTWSPVLWVVTDGVGIEFIVTGIKSIFPDWSANYSAAAVGHSKLLLPLISEKHITHSASRCTNNQFEYLNKYIHINKIFLSCHTIFLHINVISLTRYSGLAVR